MSDNSDSTDSTEPTTSTSAPETATPTATETDSSKKTTPSITSTKPKRVIDPKLQKRTFWDSQPQMKLSRKQKAALLGLKTYKPNSHDQAVADAVSAAHDDLSALPEGITPSNDIALNCPIKPNGNPATERQTPIPLVPGFTWQDLDLEDPKNLNDLYVFLRDNYVTDKESRFRFDYQKEFLYWALHPPGWLPQWHVCVRDPVGNLAAFISAIPVDVKCRKRSFKAVEINFLSIHPSWRSKGLAPVLIKEITRRVHLQDIWQALFTGGIWHPTPISSTKYWHRPLNPKKLINTRFSAKKSKVPMSMMEKLYHLPDEGKIPGCRPMEKRDVSIVTKLLNKHLNHFDLHLEYSEKEVEYWFLPREKCIQSCVIEVPDFGDESSVYNEKNSTVDADHPRVIVDFFSFYLLPTSALTAGETIYGAYSMYNTINRTTLLDVIAEALVWAKKSGCDVFNALNIMGNESVVEELRFQPGDGDLHYYLYNWNTPAIDVENLGVVLM